MMIRMKVALLLPCRTSADSTREREREGGSVSRRRCRSRQSHHCQHNTLYSNVSKRSQKPKKTKRFPMCGEQAADPQPSPRSFVYELSSMNALRMNDLTRSANSCACF